MRSREHAISFFHGCAEVVLEMELEVLESRSVFRIRLPAIQHDLIERVGAPWGRACDIPAPLWPEPLRLSFLGTESGCELGDENVKQPYVGFDAKTIVQCGFGRCPLDGELGPFSCRVDVVQNNPC